MKKSLCMVIALMLIFPLGACVKDVQIPDDSDLTVNTADEFESTCGGDSGRGIPTLAKFSRGYSDISLSITDGWEYEEVDSVGNYSGGGFGLSFWPRGEDTGRINVLFYEGPCILKCGTGIETEEISLGEYSAWMDTFYEHPIWGEITLRDTPGNYVIENSGADAWWDKNSGFGISTYGDEAMEILSSIKVGERCLPESRAIEFAARDYGDSYNRASAEFDYETGVWTVELYGDRSFYGAKIGPDGKIFDVNLVIE